jgi:hypothetical protein
MLSIIVVGFAAVSFVAFSTQVVSYACSKRK